MTEKSCTALKLLAALALVGVGSCQYAPPGPVVSEDAHLLAAAKERLLAGDYPKAVDGFAEFLARAPVPEQAGEAYYFKGLAHLALGQYYQAENSFRRLLSVKRPADLQGLARKALADTFFARGEYANAEKLYKELLAGTPVDVPGDEVLYKLGVALQRQQKWEDSETYFRRLSSAYPASSWEAAARSKLESEERFFSVQVAAFRSRQAAQRLAQELSRLGYQANTRETVTTPTPARPAGELLFVVRVGSYGTYQEASLQAQMLRHHGYETMVVP